MSALNEARILLEAAALALGINHPDIEAIRDMLKQADALLVQQLSYDPSHRWWIRGIPSLDPLSARRANHSGIIHTDLLDWGEDGLQKW